MKITTDTNIEVETECGDLIQIEVDSSNDAWLFSKAATLTVKDIDHLIEALTEAKNRMAKGGAA